MVTEFQKEVYDLICSVPKGKVTTYKGVAEQLGIRSAQAIGQALKCNPYAPDVPCHRVIASSGRIGGFKGQKTGKEVNEKIALLRKEGVVVKENGIDLEKYGFFFS